MTKRFHKVEARREAAIGEALEAAAAELVRQADRLRAQAGVSQEMALTHDRWARLPDVMRRIETDMLAGASEAAAVAKAVEDYLYVHHNEDRSERAREVLALHFRAHFREHLETNGEVRRFIRDREIMRLAHTNTNAQIAARLARQGVRLHPKSISRIVQRCLRESRPTPEPAIISSAAAPVAMIADHEGD